MKIVKYILENFGPLLAFYTANHFFGLIPAVGVAVVWTVGEIAFKKYKKLPLSSFFKFSATITILFGLVDIYFQQTVLFKYEPALSNVLVGLFFGYSLFGEKPIILQFAEAQGRIKGDIDADKLYYFQFLTVVWTLYSFVKAGFYVWVANRYTLEEGLVVRATIGNLSFYALLAVSIFGVKFIKPLLAKLRMLPSTRVARA